MVRLFLRLTMVIALFSGAFSALATDVSVVAIALFNDRAMLSVDGGKAKIVRAGDTYNNVTLISSTTKEAVIELAGKREVLTLNSGVVLSQSLAANPTDSYKTSLELYVNESGFFQSRGRINGRDIEFLVDTGANIVVLSSQHADRIGLEYAQGQRTQASTASGTAPMFLVQLDSISIGGIELENVSAGVIAGGFPQIPLLGMTFLSRVDMNRQGNTMRLTKR